MTSRPDLPAQTSLRGIAAFTVFLCHARFDRLFPQYPWMAQTYYAFNWAINAVDLFFMLSGFILCYVYLDRMKSWKHYGLARFARIYPVYLVTLLFFLSLNLLAFVKSGVFTSVSTWPIVLSNLLLVQQWVVPQFYSLNEPTWSISIEALLYVFLFPVLCFLQKFLRKEVQGVLALAPIIILCACYGSGYDPYHPGNFLSLLRGLLCFTAGFFLCCGGLAGSFQGTPRLLEWIVLPLLAVSLFTGFPLGMHYVDLLFPVVVYCTANTSSLSTRLLGIPILIWLGDLSYSIYVWHMPLIKALGVLLGLRKMGENEMRHDSFAHSLLYVAGLIGVVLLVSHLSHFYFEMPIVRWFRRWGKTADRQVKAPFAEAG